LGTLFGHAVLRSTLLPIPRLLGRGIRRYALHRGAKSFSVHTDDGIRLDGLRLAKRHVFPDRLPILFSHGWVECKEFHLHRAKHLARNGHDVMLYDHRAHGRSNGRVVTFGVRERQDMRLVLDGLQEKGWIDDKVILMGHSMGAATVIQCAALDERVAGVVAIAPFVNFRKALLTFRYRFGAVLDREWVMQGMERAAEESGFDMDDSDTLAAIEHLHAPLLLIEGGADMNLPPDIHVRPLAEAKQHGSVEVFTVPQATHFSIAHKKWPGLKEKIADFCAQVSRPQAETRSDSESAT